MSISIGGWVGSTTVIYCDLFLVVVDASWFQWKIMRCDVISLLLVSYLYNSHNTNKIAFEPSPPQRCYVYTKAIAHIQALSLTPNHNARIPPLPPHPSTTSSNLINNPLTLRIPINHHKSANRPHPLNHLPKTTKT